MGLTTEGITRVDEIRTQALKFVVTHVVYGSDGFEPLAPATPIPLDPAATSLGAEVFRKLVPPGNTVLNELYFPRGKETTYTTMGGVEATGILGEAGLIATVTDPGTTGLALGYQFLLAQAHFGRIVLGLFDRLAIVFPIAYFENPVDIAAYEAAGILYDEIDLSYSGY